MTALRFCDFVKVNQGGPVFVAFVDYEEVGYASVLLAVHIRSQELPVTVFDDSVLVVEDPFICTHSVVVNTHQCSSVPTLAL